MTKSTTDSNVTNKDSKGSDASVNGLNMYYEIHGEEKPLVLLHGGMTTIESSFITTVIREEAGQAMVLVRCKEPHQRLPAAGGCHKSRGRLLARCQWRDWLDLCTRTVLASPYCRVVSEPTVAEAARL